MNTTKPASRAVNDGARVMSRLAEDGVLLVHVPPGERCERRATSTRERGRSPSWGESAPLLSPALAGPCVWHSPSIFSSRSAASLNALLISSNLHILTFTSSGLPYASSPPPPPFPGGVVHVPKANHRDRGPVHRRRDTDNPDRAIRPCQCAKSVSASKPTGWPTGSMSHCTASSGHEHSRG